MPRFAQAFAVGQLCKGHCQILVPTREPSPMRVTAITGDTLLKLVGGQVRHKLSEYSLADIHTSLSVNSNPGVRAGSPRELGRERFKSKNSRMLLAD